jgi:hypothetical protein
MARARTGPQMADRELARLLRGYTIEVTTHNQSAVELCRTHVAPGTEVYIAFVPGEIHHAVVGTAARLHAAGFVPVPHVTARSVASPAQLRDFLARLAGEAGVTRALVIAGDLEQPAGPYRSSLELLRPGCSSSTASVASVSLVTRRRTAGSRLRGSSGRCSPSSISCAALASRLGW